MSISITPGLLLVMAVGSAPLILVMFFRFLLVRLRKKGKFSPFTEEFFRLPGHSCREHRSELLDGFFNLYLFFVVSISVLIYSVIYMRGMSRGIVALIAGLIVLYCLVKLVRLFDQVQAAKLGCEGEEYTGQELNLLMLKGAFVFHDIPYKYGNIDHVVIGNDKVFVIETKAFRKPANVGIRASRDAKVVFDGVSLKFPDFTTKQPIEQVQRHANFLDEVIQKKLGLKYTIIPVIALPGWYVETTNKKQPPLLVINPKRGKALCKWLGTKSDTATRNSVAHYIASVARSITPKSKTSDPDADKYYDFWINPRHTEKLLGDGR